MAFILVVCVWHVYRGPSAASTTGGCEQPNVAAEHRTRPLEDHHMLFGPVKAVFQSPVDIPCLSCYDVIIFLVKGPS